MGYVKKILANQKDIEDISEMYEAIESATSVKEMNRLRKSCVQLMKQDKNILNAWQKKYWSLKNCPHCGRTMPNDNDF